MQIMAKRTAHFSPLRYPGGKTGLAHIFDQILKNNNLNHITYVEPYAGGAGAALSLLLQDKVERIIINDFDYAIYSFWKSAINNTEKFINRIEFAEVTIDEWYKQKQVYKNKKSKEFDLGFATFFLNRTNRSGIVEGGPIGGLEQNGLWKINARFNKTDLIARLRRIAKYKKRIQIENLDGINLLKKLKRNKKIFIYLDPPYFNKGQSLYLNHYIENDHQQLANFLNENSNLTWLLTYDNIPNIKKLYSKLKIVEFSLNYSAYRKMKGSELMIFSDSIII